MNLLLNLFKVNIKIFIVLILFSSCSTMRKTDIETGLYLSGKKEYIQNIQNGPLHFSFNKDNYKDIYSLSDSSISEEIIFNASISTAGQKIVSVSVFGVNLERDPLIKGICLLKGGYPDNKKQIIISDALSNLN